MRSIQTGLLCCMLLALVACGSPTDNSTAAPSVSASTPATVASPPAAASAAASTQAGASSAAAGGNDAAVGNDKYSAPPAMQIDPNKQYRATIETTKGTMQVELFPKEAPKAVNNFVFLARENFYRNVKFHRIIKGFMAQTGDPLGTGTGGPGYAFEIEKPTQPYKVGTLAMANTGQPNSNGSQFFIVNGNDVGLAPDYTIFGQVTEGLDVVQKISDTPVQMAAGGIDSVPSQPTEDVRITNITITEQ